MRAGFAPTPWWIAVLLVLPGAIASARSADAARVDRPPPAATTATALHGPGIFEAARLAPQVERFAADFSRGWSQGLNNPALPPPARDRASRAMSEVAREYLAAERIGDDVRQALGRLDAAEAAAILAWWQSPLGARIAALDATAPTPERQVEMARFVGDLQVKPLPPERVQRMTDLVAAVGVGEFMRGITTQTIDGLLTALRANAAAGGAGPGTEELETRMKGALDVLAVRAEQLVRLQLLYQYRDVSDAELDRYVEFARSAPGKAYTSALYGALTGGVTRAAQALGERLATSGEQASRT